MSPVYRVHRDGTITGRGGKKLKPYPRRGRYEEMTVDLCAENNIRTQAYVHRLVALAYVDGRTKARNEIDHIDGNRHNNSADNLRWVTHQENIDFYTLRKIRERGHDLSTT